MIEILLWSFRRGRHIPDEFMFTIFRKTELRKIARSNRNMLKFHHVIFHPIIVPQMANPYRSRIVICMIVDKILCV